MDPTKYSIIIPTYIQTVVLQIQPTSPSISSSQAQNILSESHPSLRLLQSPCQNPVLTPRPSSNTVHEAAISIATVADVASAQVNINWEAASAATSCSRPSAISTDDHQASLLQTHSGAFSGEAQCTETHLASLGPVSSSTARPETPSSSSKGSQVSSDGPATERPLQGVDSAALRFSCELCQNRFVRRCDLRSVSGVCVHTAILI